jgi:glycosyltransferase involved in cell wall biosynthesis
MNVYPLVSVIIPCYNQAHFLADALESVLAQTYANFEIVVINDGSSDNTAEVVAGYSSARYFEQGNKGLSAARNTGLRESRGNYLVFLDADDRLLPGAIEAGLDCFRSHPECAFVSGQYRSIGEDGTILAEATREWVQNEYYLALLRGNYIGMHATVVYRRLILEAIGGFNTALKACEDYDVYLRIARKFPVYSYEEIVAEYRQHHASMSRNYELMLRSALVVLGSQWDYVKDSKRHLEAYYAGQKTWRNYYGRNMITSVYHRFRAGQWNQGLQELLVLSRYDRAGFASLMRKLLSPKHILRILPALWRHP